MGQRSRYRISLGRVGEGLGYQPPPPSSNRTCGFPAYGLPENLWRTADVLRLGRSPRHVILVKRCMPKHTFLGASSMCHATPLRRVRPRQGPFAPPVLLGLNATTTPSDSCSGPIAVIDSQDRSRRVPMNPPPPEQVSQVPDRSVDARCPLPPRRARPLRVLVASRPVSGFASSGRMAALTCVTRPKRVHAFALRLTSLSSRAPHPGSPRRTPSRLHGERAIPMISTFH
jgi:hypothetical protein